jgi:Shikimate 5-dehydrogenase
MAMQKLGLIGYPVAQSRSTELHRFYLQKMNIQADHQKYAISPEDVEARLNQFEAEGFLGLNVTLPLKQAVIPFIDEILPEVRKMNAVNTIHFKNGRRLGYNSDYNGVGLLLKKLHYDPKNNRALILGGGGIAMAIAHYLKDQGASEVLIFSRSPERKILNEIPLADYQELPEKIASAGILVNCTPLGMSPNLDDTPIDLSLLKNFSGVVADAIYNPMKTALIQAAESYGLLASGGLPIWIGQGFVSQEIWQEKQLNPEWMEEAETEMIKVLNR